MMTFTSKERLELLPEEMRVWFARFYERRRLQLKFPRTSYRVVDFLSYQHQQGFLLTEVSWELLTGYCLDQARRCPNRSTRQHYRSQLRQWLGFLHREGKLSQAFHKELPVRRGGTRSLRRSLTLEQVKEVLEAPDLGTAQGLLTRAVLELAYGSGLRRGELWALNLGDIDLAQGLVTVRTSKNGRGRVLPLTRASQHFLKRYLVEVRPLRCHQHSPEALFLNPEGQRPHRLHWLRALRASFSRPLSFYFHLHLLRHSSATHLLAAGVDVATVQAFLGHLHLSSTQRYTHLSPALLVEVHRRCHPRNLNPLPSR